MKQNMSTYFDPKSISRPKREKEAKWSSVKHRPHNKPLLDYFRGSKYKFRTGQIEHETKKHCIKILTNLQLCPGENSEGEEQRRDRKVKQNAKLITGKEWWNPIEGAY